MFWTIHLLRMHWVWWVVIVGLLVWIFLTPNHMNGHRSKKDLQLNKLKKMLEKGQITEEEFFEQKQLLEKE
jgi:putative membrane protein